MNKSYILPIFALLTLTITSGLILASTSVSADDVVDDVTITVPMSCTMTGTGQDSHTASINPGTYNSSIGLTTIKAFCNDHEGFAIYAIGYTDEEDGKNVLTSSTLGSTSDITTSTATSGNNSAWAMKLSVPQSPTPTYPMTIQSDTEGSFSSFHTVPDDYTLVAKRTSSTDIGQNAEGSSLTTTYQAYISQTQPAGTYTGKVKYTMVHPHDGAAPEIPHVSFEDAFADAGKTKLNGYYKMQDFSSSICEAVNLYDEDSQTQLIDVRDNKVYWIAKLRDDNCWMTQDLTLDLNEFTTFTNQNTDLGWNQSTNSYDSASWTPEYSDTVTTPYYDEYGDYVWNGTFGSSETTDIGDVTDETELHYRSGIMYNWTAAIAMNDSSRFMEESGSSNQSICPTNWTLPSAWNDYHNLFTLYYGDDYTISPVTPWQSPVYYTLGGYRNYGELSELGTTGVYWTNETYGYSEVTYASVFNGTNVEGAGSLYLTDCDRDFLFSVRCIAR